MNTLEIKSVEQGLLDTCSSFQCICTKPVDGAFYAF